MNTRPGRKRTYYDQVPIQVHMSTAQVQKLDVYARKKGIPRSEAIRQLVEVGLLLVEEEEAER